MFLLYYTVGQGSINQTRKIPKAQLVCRRGSLRQLDLQFAKKNEAGCIIDNSSITFFPPLKYQNKVILYLFTQEKDEKVFLAATFGETNISGKKKKNKGILSSLYDFLYSILRSELLM